MPMNNKVIQLILIHVVFHIFKGSGSHLQSQNVRLDKHNGM